MASNDVTATYHTNLGDAFLALGLDSLHFHEGCCIKLLLEVTLEQMCILLPLDQQVLLTEVGEMGQRFGGREGELKVKEASLLSVQYLLMAP